MNKEIHSYEDLIFKIYEIDNEIKTTKSKKRKNDLLRHKSRLNRIIKKVQPIQDLSGILIVDFYEKMIKYDKDNECAKLLNDCIALVCEARNGISEDIIKREVNKIK